jgi:AbrB family looped-hinge helix DNA binding protein
MRNVTGSSTLYAGNTGGNHVLPWSEAMDEHLTTLTRKGQITVPSEIRRALGLERGDRIAVSLDEDGARLRRVGSVVDETFGVFRAARRAERATSESQTAIDDIAENAANEGRRESDKGR